MAKRKYNSKKNIQTNTTQQVENSSLIEQTQSEKTSDELQFIDSSSDTDTIIGEQKKPELIKQVNTKPNSSISEKHEISNNETTRVGEGLIEKKLSLYKDIVRIKLGSLITKLKSLRPTKKDITTILDLLRGFIIWFKELNFRDIVQSCVKHFSIKKVMNTLSIISIVFLGGFAIYSYLFSFPKALEPIQENELPKVTHNNYFVDIDVDKVSTETILWNSRFRDAISKSLSNDTYIKLQQVTSSVNKKGNLANVALTTELIVDFATQRLYCITDMTDNIGQKHNEYFYDNIENLYLTKIEPDDWVKSQKVAVNVNFNLGDYANCADFYKFLLNDFGIKNNTEGRVIEDHVYFDYTRPALDRDLTSISYDNLLDTNIQLVFKRISDTEMQPVSMIKQVEFESNDNVYSSKLVILFEETSHTELAIPSYKDYLEEAYDSDDLSEK